MMNTFTEPSRQTADGNITCAPIATTAPANHSDKLTTREQLLIELEHLQHCQDNPVIRYIILSIICFTIVSTFFGNSLIIAAHIKNKKFHESSVYKLLLNVAISDLILGISLLKFPVSEIFPRVLESYTICITRTVLVTTSMASSILFLSIVSVDRFTAIIFPFRYRINNKKGRRFVIMTLVMWAFCIFGGLILIGQNKFLKFGLQDTALRSCPITWVVDETYSVLSALFMATSIIVNSILYVIVLRRIIQRRDSQLSSSSACISRTITRTKLTISVHVIFAICWVPCLTIVFLAWFYSSNLDMKCYREHALTLGYLNSGLNWILYGITNHVYRDEFKLLLCRCRQRGAIQTHSSRLTNGTNEASVDSQRDYHVKTNGTLEASTESQRSDYTATAGTHEASDKSQRKINSANKGTQEASTEPQHGKRYTNKGTTERGKTVNDGAVDIPNAIENMTHQNDNNMAHGTFIESQKFNHTTTDWTRND